MKCAVILSLLSLAAAAVLENRGECPGNNCNRAVMGTRPGLLPFASRSADCSSFLRGQTVTPPAVTTTITVEEDDYYDDEPTSPPTSPPTPAPTPTATATQKLSKRNDRHAGWLAWLEGRHWQEGAQRAERSGIPDYADNCSDAAEYMTACSCFGVTAGAAATAPTPTVTVTQTVPVDWCDDL